MMSAAHDLVVATRQGLFCPSGDFYIDPWQPVQNAVITHAHGDHLRAGSSRYFCSAAGETVTRVRLPNDATLVPVPYGEPFTFNRTQVSFHPAGHILGSSQIRVEVDGVVWVVSGDYKRDPDPTCAPFEVLRCDTFISEATFALPAYRWPDIRVVAGDIFAWWQENKRAGVSSVLFAYALGKAQRVLAELTAFTEEPVYVHGAVASLVEAYRQCGVRMLPTLPATVADRQNYSGALVMAPPSAAGSTWLRRFGESRTGFCSGWMRVRGNRRRRGYDRGFVLSDHADWPGLIRTIRETQANRVLLTHGHTDALCRYLVELGIAASALTTEYGAEE